ncbi:MAG: hypothetical protein K0R46_287 [Herbinix sp.]|jgi:hypothetical protein|nr:hypothetical protein [Herbinix sp.]
MAELGNYMNGVTLLIALKRRIKIFLIAIVICVLLLIIAYIFYGERVITNVFIVIILVLMCTLLLMITLSYKKIMTAKLIIENRIMHIRQAQIIDEKNCAFRLNKKLRPDIEVFVSCFGILVDSKIVKFNLDGVTLKSVELSDRYITLTYGTESRSEKIRILHETLTIQEMIRITESFRYETGVTPVLVDEK